MKRKIPKILLPWKTILTFLAFFVLFFTLLAVIANWQAFRSELTYREPAATPTSSPAVAESTATPATPTPIPAEQANRIVIDKIRVNAPISWDISPEATPTYLDKGVSHLLGTAKPGEVGNVFILGHSSDYVWKKNPYAAVFALLPKLTVGDTIKVYDASREHIYTVASTKIISPYQVEVADPTTTPVLTLVTCYPVGTTQKRYVVQAKLTSQVIGVSTVTGPAKAGVEFR